jgi:hypothetical protein
LINSALSQTKYIIDDFEGFADGSSELKMNGMFSFGNVKTEIQFHESSQKSIKPDYLGSRCISTKNYSTKDYGGWGKGICLNINIDPKKDYLNFYILQPNVGFGNRMRIQLQEDDNNSNVYEKEKDDAWIVEITVPKSDEWQLASIPLSRFIDENDGGDGVFNCNYKEGKLLCFIVSFLKSSTSSEKGDSQPVLFDFVSFSEGPLLNSEFENVHKHSSLGLWSEEGNSANFVDIAKAFNGMFVNETEKKLAVIHFFQPFAFDGGVQQNNYPSIERINKVIEDGYIPMITLENHFVNVPSKVFRSDVKQPNLTDIIRGDCDQFLVNWSKHIKQVNGIILLRIFHEFNGDWYPWCIANNSHNPELLIKAFRHIYDVFRDQKVSNVRFVWCPNSMSVPQESWNYIMDAYPGDEYVDFVGLDVYNGAGESKIWTSFRKVAIENYFILTKQLPDKPLFICETASRERRGNERGQNKAEWIEQMSEAVVSDMSDIKLISWFNEKEYFKINSSQKSRDAFLKYILRKDFFKSGTSELMPLVK